MANRYFLAFIHNLSTDEVNFKFLYETCMVDAYKRFLDRTTPSFFIIDITDLTLREVEEYSERYAMCILR